MPVPQTRAKSFPFLELVEIPPQSAFFLVRSENLNEQDDPDDPPVVLGIF